MEPCKVRVIQSPVFYEKRLVMQTVNALGRAKAGPYGAQAVCKELATIDGQSVVQSRHHGEGRRCHGLVP